MWPTNLLANSPTPSAALSPTTPASLSSTPAVDWPPGGPVPAQLVGDWFEPAKDLQAASGVPCPPAPTAANCFFHLTLTATIYRQAVTARDGTQAGGEGNVVVNNNEIDFFNGVICGLKLPDGVGRYAWALTGGHLQFTLIADPCPRGGIGLRSGSWGRTH